MNKMDSEKKAKGEDKEKRAPTESLPLAERIKLAESFNYFAGITAGWVIDAKDNVDCWRVAEVLNVEEHFIKVNFDGWGTKYDEVVSFIYFIVFED